MADAPTKAAERLHAKDERLIEVATSHPAAAARAIARSTGQVLDSEREREMSGILSATELRKKIAIAQGEKASAALKALQQEEAEKQALLDKMTRPSGLSDDEILEKASIIINRALENGLTAVQVYRFPHTLCTDNGRAINQAEEGWEKTLSGVPKEIYEFWKRQLQPRGYHIRYEIVDYPGGMPGDVGIILSWA